MRISSCAAEYFNKDGLVEFAEFVDLFARIRERTHARHGADPSPLLPGEFVQFAQDLLAGGA